MRLLAAKEHAAFAIRSDAMDFSLVPGSHQQIALAVERQRPDVLGLRIVKDFRFSSGRNFVDFAIRVGGDEYLVLAVDGDGVDFQGVEFSERLLFAARGDPVQLGVRPAARIHVSS